MPHIGFIGQGQTQEANYYIEPCFERQFLKPLPDGSGVYIVGGMRLAFQGSDGLWRTYAFSTDTTLTQAALDTGVFELGKDYYVYLTQNGDLVLSLNATAPQGYDSAEVYKIGGFHYGRVRTIEQRFDASATLAVQVVPNSVWDLRHRPRCSDPSGMVKVGDFWVDIYLSSEDGTPWPNTVPLSRYNATPFSGTEGYAYIDYLQLARNAGKRLPTYAEFLQYAYGVPEGVVGVSSTVATGSVAWLVSCLNVDQPSGNLWQVGADFMAVGEDGSWEWYEWTKSGKDSAQETGSIVQQTADMLRQLIFGGGWANGAGAGARCVYLDSRPWDVGSYVGMRCVCDSI
jgi:hypothetical protein